MAGEQINQERLGEGVPVSSSSARPNDLTSFHVAPLLKTHLPIVPLWGPSYYLAMHLRWLFKILIRAEGRSKEKGGSMVLTNYGGNMLFSYITRTCVHVARAVPRKRVTRRGCWSFRFISICPSLEGCNCKDVGKQTGERANVLWIKKQ